MTVIVGLVCKDGLVIASDSQESDDDIGMKRLDVTKIYDNEFFKFDDVDIIVAGTGASAYIARAAELIEEKGYAPHFTTPRTVANIVEDVFGEMKSRYGGGDDFELELMVGVHCKNCPKGDDPPLAPIALYSIFPPDEEEKIGVAEPIIDYGAMGSGGLFARYLLNRLHDEEHPPKNLTVDAAIREAVYVIEEVTKVDLWCGGPTQLFCIRQRGSGYVLERKKPEEVKLMGTDLAIKDIEIKKKQRQIFLDNSIPKRGKQ